MSQMRRCDIFKATDGKFYMILGNHEYAEDDWDCTTYGQFDSAAEADDYLRKNFSNPGGGTVDEDGTEPVPPEYENVKKRCLRSRY